MAKEILTAEQLRAVFSYDPETGVVMRGRRVAGYVGNGRMVVEYKGRQLSLARIAWILQTGSPPPHSVSFRNGNPLDLRWANLIDIVDANDERRPELTPQRIREVLDYDPVTGALTWITSRKSGAQAGERAEVATNTGYFSVRIDGKLLLAHRVAWAHHHGKWPEHVIDHIDSNGQNNSMANLRDVPQGLNLQNRRGAQVNNKARCRGVHYMGRGLAKPWNGQIKLAGVITRRSFETLLDAAAWVISTRRALMPCSKDAMVD